MNIIKEVSTGKVVLVLVKTPEKLFITILGDHELIMGDGYGDRTSVKLPKGFKYKELGLSSHIKEEQCRDLMPQQSSFGKMYYMRSNQPNIFDETLTAKESFASLMQSVGAYTENPYGADKPIISDPDPYSQYHGAQMDELAKWNEAEANTGSWLVLIKEPIEVIEPEPEVKLDLKGKVIESYTVDQDNQVTVLTFTDGDVLHISNKHIPGGFTEIILNLY